MIRTILTTSAIVGHWQSFRRQPMRAVASTEEAVSTGAVSVVEAFAAADLVAGFSRRCSRTRLRRRRRRWW